MDAETRRVLATAKGIVANGWYQGGYADGRGNYCIRGAVVAACGSSLNLEWDAYRALADALGRFLLGAWNDEPGRTQAEVVALFDKALTDNPAPAETETRTEALV